MQVVELELAHVVRVAGDELALQRVQQLVHHPRVRAVCSHQQHLRVQAARLVALVHRADVVVDEDPHEALVRPGRGFGGEGGVVEGAAKVLVPQRGQRSVVQQLPHNGHVRETHRLVQARLPDALPGPERLVDVNQARLHNHLHLEDVAALAGFVKHAVQRLGAPLRHHLHHHAVLVLLFAAAVCWAARHGGSDQRLLSTAERCAGALTRVGAGLHHVLHVRQDVQGLAVRGQLFFDNVSIVGLAGC
mmetsp:Transcript_4975/g.9350  ORF Transcript_4975/g.9350 Transcript_4975/m.9350 type:complete len:247 (-) Transcript_4975:483-1223(-)